MKVLKILYLKLLICKFFYFASNLIINDINSNLFLIYLIIFEVNAEH